MNKNIPHLNSSQLLSGIGITDWDDKDFSIIHSGLPLKFTIPYPFRPTDYLIGFVTEGSVRALINLREFNFNKNSLIVISPFNILESISQSDDLTVSGVSFTKNFITEHLADIHMLENLPFLAQGNIPVMTVAEKDVALLNNFFLLIESLAKNKKNPHRKKMIRNVMEAFLYGVDAVYQPEFSLTGRRSSRKEELSIKLQSLVAQHFKDQRSVSFYAEKLNVTSKYLSESVKEISGKTAGELIDEMVILEAKVLLKNSNLTISQVADLLHFSDQFLFSKFFKGHAGFSPSEYRKR
jgi:AraC family transcriptional activator of pobA